MSCLSHVWTVSVAGFVASCASTTVAPTHSTRSADAPVAPVPATLGEHATPALPAHFAESSELTLWQEEAAPTGDRTTGDSMAEDEGWHFVLAPYAWLLSVDGTANMKGQDSTLDEDFGDIFDQLNFVIEGRFEAWKGEWGFMADITYSELENDLEIAGLKGETSTDLTLAFLGAMYRFVDQEYKDSPGGVTVDAVAGIAYTDIDGNLDFDNGASFDGGEDITDPIVGLRGRWAFSEKWGGSLETIIGGFELFDGSDLITMSTALVGRKVGESGHFYFGWRTLDIDYENDEDGSDRFDMNININGPIIGYEWGF